MSCPSSQKQQTLTITGNSNSTQVIKAKDMIKEQWFQDTLHTKDPIDLFVLIGHNPVGELYGPTTLKLIFETIREAHPKTPITVFGGHTHIRDFTVFDESSVGIESGRYCETLGWVSMSGFDSSNSGYKGIKNPHGVANPSRPAVEGSKSPFKYSRRYLDWNRRTFIYHSRQKEATYDYHSGQRITHDITDIREELRLGDVHGCAPESWCMDCAAFEDEKNIFQGVIKPAISAIVVNKTRADKPRIIFGNTGSVRFDIHKGPFTFDDNFIVSPFRDVFRYLKDVPYSKAKLLIDQ